MWAGGVKIPGDRAWAQVRQCRRVGVGGEGVRSGEDTGCEQGSGEPRLGDVEGRVSREPLQPARGSGFFQRRSGDMAVFLSGQVQIRFLLGSDTYAPLKR